MLVPPLKLLGAWSPAPPPPLPTPIHFGFEGGMWDLIVLDPDYCFSFYFT